MRRVRLSWFSMTVFAGFMWAGSASAHEGHDHDTPSGLWENHEVTDVQLYAAGITSISYSSGPDLLLSSWLLSDGSSGYSTQDTQTDNNVSSILADVNTVAYDDNYVYIRTSGIPSHDIGTANDPNPATAGDLDATYRISFNPTEETGEKTSTGLSAIGVMVNGVSFYNQSDGFAWDPLTNQINGRLTEQSEWSVNALWSRADGLDEAGGHSSPVFGSTNDDGSVLGQYHYHQTPYGLLEQIDGDNDGTMGSVIVGYAYDSYAVVGPYAYEEQEDGTLVAVQMTSSYGLEDNRGENGPSTADYELGSFLEDFVYIEGSGTLNEYNMAFVKFDAEGRAVLTDESDEDGDWAYFLTLDVIDAISGNDTTVDGGVAYPYIVGPEYYGVVDTDLITRGSVIDVPDDVSYYFQYVPEPTGMATLLVISLITRNPRHRAHAPLTQVE